MTIRVGIVEWKPLGVETKSNKKRESSSFLSPRIGETRETEEDVRSREVSPYNRLGSLTYAEPPSASFACHLHHHLTSDCSFCIPRSTTSSFSSLSRSRCTVALGLCIIITITASSSWLVVEKPPRILLLSFPSPFASPPSFLFLPLAPFRSRCSSVRKREMKKKRKRAAYVRVCVC